MPRGRALSEPRGFQGYANKNHGLRPARPRNGKSKTKETFEVRPLGHRHLFRPLLDRHRPTQDARGNLVFIGGTWFSRGNWRLARGA
jgi:hypothetical protein